MTQVLSESSGKRSALRGAGLRLLALLALVVAILVAIDARPAGAHGGDGAIEVGEPTPSGELTVTVPIRITYVDDGHAAEEVGPLVVDGTGPDGATFGRTEPFVAGDAPGVFEASLVFPSAGTWELTITSTEPPATAPLTVEVPPLGPDEATSDQDAPADDAPVDEEEPVDDEEPVEEGDADDTVGSGDPEVGGEAVLVDQDGDDSGAVLPLVLGGLVLLAIIGGGIVWRRRQST